MNEYAANESRRFVRHTIHVPLEISTPVRTSAENHASNVSHGGLSFPCDKCLDLGEVVHLKIPTVEPPFEADARVVWCRPEDDHFLVGVAFNDPNDAFQSRMVQQVCAIENYRQEVAAQEGRMLSTQEAAAEWIEKFAGRFPST